mmetsp:Transcript_7297/g.17803  ORF Transcript_7297/g.17803 Transcript_7297/m.17803 type:complete len:241 (-) Transcript_7297:17-739(-)
MRTRATLTPALLLSLEVLLHVVDGGEHQAVLLAENPQLRHARHAAIVVANLAEHAALGEPRHLAEVDRGLRVPVALEHAAIAWSQREDVPGPVEVSGNARGICQCPEGGGAVGGRNPRGCAHLVVHAHGECGLLGVLVVDHHRGQLELVQPIALHRTADHPRGVSDNEADIRGRGKLGGHDQVALIFAALVVRNHNQLSLLDRLDRRDHRLRPELRWCHHGLRGRRLVSIHRVSHLQALR